MSLTSDDIYDEAHKWFRDVLLPDVNVRFARRPNGIKTMEEIDKFVTDKCYEKGYLVRVKTSECMLGIGPLDIELTGVVADSDYNRYGTDFEKRQWETRRSVDRAEEGDMRKWLQELNRKS